MNRNANDDLWHKRGFAQGIAVACSTLVSVWGDEVAALEIVRSAGLDTRAKMRALGVEKYDLDILKPIFAVTSSKAKSNRSPRRSPPLR